MPTLQHRVAIQRRSTTDTTLGQPGQAWVTVATVWALVAPIRGREWFAAGQSQATADVRVTVRKRSDLTADTRIVPAVGSPMEGQPLIVQGIPIEVLDDNRQFVELMCMAGARDGR
jgi:SPP1 family predicted phage head-tail adaptor